MAFEIIFWILAGACAVNVIMLIVRFRQRREIEQLTKLIAEYKEMLRKRRGGQ